jgi:hypothetical protein
MLILVEAWFAASLAVAEATYVPYILKEAGPKVCDVNFRSIA